MRALAAALLAASLGVAAAAAQVPFSRLVASDDEPENWLTYSGNYQAQRFSGLWEINRGNVADLRVEWVYQFKDPGVNETTPLVVDGVMYVSEALGRVTALDARTGRQLWTWTRTLPDDLITIGFPRANRGVALLGDKVYIGTLDSWLYALDAKSGAVRWSTEVAENAGGYSITAAPLAVDGKIIVGVSGGETGIRGFVDAYDAETGERAWRLWTVPGPGEPGNDTWGGDSWKTGAGATWLTGAYDPELDLVYWGTGNPAPDWNGDDRPGDNLYTCSMLAIDPKDGSLRWYFQFTPHDTHDWDSNQIPVLVDLFYDGRDVKALAMANRNGFYYLLDRETGKFLTARPYVKQTWAEGIDANGRPILIPGMDPSEEGTLVYPSLQGGVNWNSPSYDAIRGHFYVPVREMGAVYFKSEVEHEPGRPFMGGGERALSGDQASGWVRALDVLTGEKRWEFKVRTPLWAGLLSTTGGLVFGGTNEGNLFALNAENGEPLWRLNVGGGVRAGPMSFAVEGRQLVAVAAGGSLFVLGLPPEDEPAP